MCDNLCDWILGYIKCKKNNFMYCNVVFEHKIQSLCLFLFNITSQFKLTLNKTIDKSRAYCQECQKQ